MTWVGWRGVVRGEKSASAAIVGGPDGRKSLVRPLRGRLFTAVAAGLAEITHVPRSRVRIAQALDERVREVLIEKSASLLAPCAGRPRCEHAWRPGAVASRRKGTGRVVLIGRESVAPRVGAGSFGAKIQGPAAAA